MVPKHSLDTSTNAPSPDKRVRKVITPIVKPSYRANFDRLCALHNWTPSEAVREKLARLIQLSRNRLQASELLPLAFVQHYPFIWMKDFLLLGYNDANDSVWYKAFPTGRGLARGRYYNSSQTNILGKHTVTKFWQSWVDVFDIEQRGLDRSHEYFTGVYLILKKFPNLRYRCDQRHGDPRNPQNAARVTGVPEYPFNDDHPFMQPNDVEQEEPEDNIDSETTDTDSEDQDDASFTKREQTASHDDEEDSNTMLRQPREHVSHASHANSLNSMSTFPSRSPAYPTGNQADPFESNAELNPLPHHLSRQPIFRASSSKPTLTPSTRSSSHTNSRTSTPTKSPYFARKRKQNNILEIPRHKSQSYKDYTLRVPIDEPRWSNTNFKFAVMRSVYTLPM
jgi:hypothetical protein